MGTTSSTIVGLIILMAVGLQSCGSEPQIVEKEWPVEGKLLGPERDGDKQKKSRDVSGIACDRESGFPRRCLVIDDESQAAQAVTVYDGRIVAGRAVPLIANTFSGKPLELDGEAVSYADGAFYVMGSHGHPRDRKHKLDEGADADEIAAKIKASSQLLRVTLPQSAWDGEPGTAGDAQVQSSDRVREAIKSLGELAPWVDRRLDDNGLTIEGAAVAQGKLYIGCRGPLLDNTSAAIVAVGLRDLYGTGPLNPVLVKLDLGGRGIRDLAYDHGVFTVLAGPVADTGGSDYAIFTWDGTSAAAKLVAIVPSLDEDEKPEAILPLESTAQSLRVLVLYDGAKEGGPREFTLPR